MIAPVKGRVLFFKAFFTLSFLYKLCFSTAITQMLWIHSSVATFTWCLAVTVGTRRDNPRMHFVQSKMAATRRQIKDSGNEVGKGKTITFFNVSPRSYGYHLHVTAAAGGWIHRNWLTFYGWIIRQSPILFGLRGGRKKGARMGIHAERKSKGQNDWRTDLVATRDPQGVAPLAPLSCSSLGLSRLCS